MKSQKWKKIKNTWIKRWTTCLRLYIILFCFQSFLYSYALCPGSPRMLLVYLSLSSIPRLASLLSLPHLKPEFSNLLLSLCSLRILFKTSTCPHFLWLTFLKLLFILSHLLLICYSFKFLRIGLFVFKLLLNTSHTYSSLRVPHLVWHDPGQHYSLETGSPRLLYLLCSLLKQERGHKSPLQPKFCLYILFRSLTFGYCLLFHLLFSKITCWVLWSSVVISQI